MKSGPKQPILRKAQAVQVVAPVDGQALIEIHVRGTKSRIVLIAQQLAWMMSALQTQNDTDIDTMIYSHFRIGTESILSGAIASKRGSC